MVFNPPHPLILNWLFFLRRYVNVKDPHQAAAAHHDPAASSSPLTSAASEASSIRTLSSTAETSAGGFDTGNSAANGAINLSVDRPQQQQQQDSSGRAPPPGVLPQEPSEYLCTIEDFFVSVIWVLIADMVVVPILIRRQSFDVGMSFKSDRQGPLVLTLRRY